MRRAGTVNIKHVVEMTAISTDQLCQGLKEHLSLKKPKASTAVTDPWQISLVFIFAGASHLCLYLLPTYLPPLESMTCTGSQFSPLWSCDYKDKILDHGS